jgi:Flp pilus assembly protein TadG
MLSCRFAETACINASPGHERRPALTRGCRPGPGLIAGSGKSTQGERGSAVVEFTFLALLLMVPLVYFIITVGQIQGGAFAVVGAADQAAKVYVAQPDAESGRTAAEQAVMIALADYGHPADNARMDASCQPSDCLAPGSAVTVTVHLTVPLPFVPFSDSFRLNASQLDASATQVVGRFR